MGYAISFNMKSSNKSKLLIACMSLSVVGCNSGTTQSTPQNSDTTQFIPQSQYTIAIDSGSSGNKIYVYKVTPPYSYPTISALFESSNSIPLAGFVSNPESAGPIAIQPLLIQAAAYLNKINVPTKTVITSDLGTAGMRLIPPSSQIAIYSSVAQTITQESFALGQAATITGQQEGLFSWTDVNYLTDGLRKNNTNGIIEMGGASSQIAFKSPYGINNSNITSLCANNINYNVYSVSYLGLGQDRARDTMNLAPDYNACYPVSYSATVGGVSINGSFGFESCIANYKVVTESPAFSSLAETSSQPGFSGTSFIGLASIYYAFAFWNITSNPSQVGLESGISSLCSENYTTMQSQYLNAHKLQNQCANSTYVDTFLYNSVHVGNQLVSANLAINNINLTWTLGYVFNQYTSISENCK